MPFRALVYGKSMISLRIQRDAWEQLIVRARAGEDVLHMSCCGAPGIFKRSRRDRQFFAHKSQPATCDWKPESLEHIDLKAVVCDTVENAPGWSADIEVEGPNWKADVLATRGRMRIAFEVQLSTQGQAETAFREHRYQDADVLPWWIVTSRRNAGEGFGSGLRSVVEGADFPAVATNTAKAVRNVLKRVESQVRIAEAIALFLRDRSISYRQIKFCELPVGFSFELSGEGRTRTRTQNVVIGEVGADVMPGFESLVAGASDNPWGSVVQFVRHARQVKGFNSSAFYLRSDPRDEVPRILGQLFSGQLAWRGEQHTASVEAALIWYAENCESCGKPFARVPFAIANHLHHWPNREPKLEFFKYDRMKPWTQEVVRRFEERTGLLIGSHWQPGNGPDTPALQNCPHCGSHHSKSLISAADALRLWPYRTVDWTITIADPGTGWEMPRRPLMRWRPPTDVWTKKLVQLREEREQAAAEEQRRREEQARKEAEEQERLKRERAEKAAIAEAARKAEEQRRREEAERRRAEDLAAEAALRKIRDEESRAKLLRLAASKLGRADRAQVWMNAFHPKLQGRPADVCLQNFEWCAALLETRK